MTSIFGDLHRENSRRRKMMFPFPAMLLPLILLLLSIFYGISASNAAGTSPCGGDGWQQTEGGKKCVKLFPARTGWNVGEINCAYQGGHHISVRDVHENRFLSDLAREAGQVWLGAAQFGQSRDYVWVDGTPFGGFQQWHNNAPPPFHRGKKCLKLDGHSGQWVQSCCRVAAASICQRPVPDVPGQIQEDLSALAKEEREQFRH